MLNEPSSRYPTDAPNTIPTVQPSSDIIAHPNSNQDSFKQGIQESQVSLHKNLTISIIYRAAGTQYMVQNVFYVLSITEGRNMVENRQKTVKNKQK